MLTLDENTPITWLRASGGLIGTRDGSMNKKLTIKVKGVTVTEGAHKIGMSFIAEGLGQLGFEVTDIASPG